MRWLCAVCEMGLLGDAGLAGWAPAGSGGTGCGLYGGRFGVV